MSQNFTENRSGPRYVAYFPVRAEWDDEESGAHVIAEGQTENVGPEGALVHLERLPSVGGRVQLAVLEDEDGAGAAQAVRVQAVAEVLRVERNPVQPLAALQLVNASDEWRGLVYTPASTWERDHTRIEYDDD
ncbi:MAG TPA: hypothetical protein VIP46_20140 [Pyrinomonadaceae bacterium]